MNIEELKYPIGKYQFKDSYTKEEIVSFITRIEALPANIAKETSGLTDNQLDTPYRDGGWTVRQVIHHVADSHMNAYIRTKWTLTEETPTIKAYEEGPWAETAEIKSHPAVSLELIKHLHSRWLTLLKTLTAEQLLRQFIHPQTKRHVRLDQMMGLYAWHGDHHLAHITSLKKRNNWN